MTTILPTQPGLRVEQRHALTIVRLEENHQETRYVVDAWFDYLIRFYEVASRDTPLFVLQDMRAFSYDIYLFRRASQMAMYFPEDILLYEAVVVSNDRYGQMIKMMTESVNATITNRIPPRVFTKYDEGLRYLRAQHMRLAS